ncbi:Nitrite reductase [NAD(P)H] large subunit [Staphylococcus aureus]|nr:Nitrite reductase [NAD(P)H] large subunit [Staphylococcus aureus]
MAKQKLVMIGNGMAGIRTIEEILERANDLYDITVIGKEPYPNYNRIMLSNILQNKMTVEETIMNPYEWYEEHGIELITNDPVIEVDRANQSVTTANGIEVSYDKLIFATGSKAFVIPVPGELSLLRMAILMASLQKHMKSYRHAFNICRLINLLMRERYMVKLVLYMI